MEKFKVLCPTDSDWKVNLLNSELNSYGLTVMKYSLTDKKIHTDFARSAEMKAIAAFSETGTPTLAMDVGFYIKSLKGWPHTNISYEIASLGLRAISDIVTNYADRSFRYGVALAYLGSHMYSPKICKHEFLGEIDVVPREQNEDKEVTNLEKIMIPEGYYRSIGSMDSEQRKDFKETKETSYKEFGEWFLKNRTKFESI